MRSIYSLVIVVLVVCFHILYIFQDQSFFDRQFEQLGSYERQEQVMDEAKILMNYRGNADELVMSNVYTQSEKEHLYDVKQLIHTLEYVFLICVLLTIIGLRYIYSPGFFALLRMMMLGLLIVFIVVSGVGWFAWDWLFVHFHELFFSGNWMFAGDSFLIQSYPWEFFRNAMVAVMTRSGVTLLLLLCLLSLSVCCGKNSLNKLI